MKSSVKMSDSAMPSIPANRLIRFVQRITGFRRASAASLICSVLVHLLILVLFACWLLPGMTSVFTKLEATFSEESELAESESVEISVLPFASSGDFQTDLSVSATAITTNATASESRSVSPQMAPQPKVTLSSPGSLTSLTDADLMSKVEAPIWTLPIHRHRGETRMLEAENAAGIGANLAGQLESISGDGDAVVVWLLDQSISMQQDLQSLAVGLKDSLIQIEQSSRHKMTHYVIAFGDDVKVVQDSTTKGLLVAKAIYGLPQDPSGVENTFQAVEWAVGNIFLQRRWFRKKPQMLLVIWTDESGDDFLRLEQTIQLCRQANVRVDIIGPSAVLGSQVGYTRFVHPADNLAYYLPVTRGPDSAFKEKPYLPYWHRAVPLDYDESMRGPFQGTAPGWQGGSDFKSMLSGFSPYALTRLSKETGGIYTLYDRPGDRSPFTLEALKDYLPDYRSVAEIDFENRRYPLRRAVQQAAEISWSENFTPPRFFFPPTRGGQPPVDYRNSLPERLQAQVEHCAQLSQRLDRCLQMFRGGDIEEARKADPSKRWGAWTDLTMGRLLAVSVRVREYLLAVEALSANRFSGLGPQTNTVSFLPNQALLGDAVSAATAAEAERYLRRCAEENRGTPWQFLAERELQSPVGILIQQGYVPPPPPPRIAARPVAPRPPVQLPKL
jgi:hypothetical protein